MSCDFSSLTPGIIDKWDTNQLCAALIEAKKIEKSVELLKEKIREKVISGSRIDVSNGCIRVTKPSRIFFIANENIIPECFLLPPIRLLNKKKVQAHFSITEGQLPMGVGSKNSKASVIVQVK